MGEGRSWSWPIKWQLKYLTVSQEFSCYLGPWGYRHLRFAFSSLQLLSHVQLFVTPWTVARRASLSITSSRDCSNSCPLSRWCHPTISCSVIPFSSRLQSSPPSGSFQWVSSSYQVAKLSEVQLQHQSFQRIFRTDFLLCAPGPCYDNRTSVKSVCHTLNPCQYLPKSIFLILAFWMGMNCYIIVFNLYFPDF